MAHAQKPDFVFRRNGRVHLNQLGFQFSRLLAAEVCESANAGYTMFRGSVRSTDYPLHSPVSPSLPRPSVTVCHHISTGLYHISSPNQSITENHNGPTWNVRPQRKMHLKFGGKRWTARSSCG